MKKKKDLYQKKGFTLPEVLTAVFLIIISSVGIFIFFPKIISSSEISSLELVGSYLAQEGIEIVRNIRDQNLIALEDWDKGIEEGFWRVQYNKNYLLNFSDDFLKLNNAGFYNYDDGQNTPFKREIIIEKKENGRAILVTSKVSYIFRGKVYNFSCQEYLYKWIQ